MCRPLGGGGLVRLFSGGLPGRIAGRLLALTRLPFRATFRLARLPLLAAPGGRLALGPRHESASSSRLLDGLNCRPLLATGRLAVRGSRPWWCLPPLLAPAPGGSLPAAQPGEQVKLAFEDTVRGGGQALGGTF